MVEKDSYLREEPLLSRSLHADCAPLHRTTASQVKVIVFKFPQKSKTALSLKESDSFYQNDSFKRQGHKFVNPMLVIIINACKFTGSLIFAKFA